MARIIRGWKDGSGPVQYVAFTPSKSSLATGNRGTFSAGMRLTLYHRPLRFLSASAAPPNGDHTDRERQPSTFPATTGHFYWR